MFLAKHRFCRPLRPVLLLVLIPRLWSPLVDVLGLCWMWQDVPFARQRRPAVGILKLCWLLWGSFDCFCCPHTSVLRASTTCLSVYLCEPQVPCPAIWLLFLYGALDSHPFFPSRAAPGRCVLTAAAAGVLAGVGCVSVGPGS